MRSRQPLGEHPRPQLQRKRWKSLNGLWERNGTRILVPFPPESLLSGVAAGAARGRTAVYRTSFGVPPEWKVDGGASMALHFGAVDWRCRVAVNGVGVAEHSGGFTPFTADVSAALDTSLEGQQLEVWVNDPSEDGGQPLGKQRETSRGIWYTAVSGIWQSVWLELRPPTFVSAVSFATVDLRAGRVRVDVEMRAPGAPATADAEIEARLRFAPPSKAIGPSGWWADDAFDGATAWTAQFGELGRDSVQAVMVAPDGDVVAAGHSDSNFGGCSSGLMDAWVARVNPEHAHSFFSELDHEHAGIRNLNSMSLSIQRY